MMSSSAPLSVDSGHCEHLVWSAQIQKRLQTHQGQMGVAPETRDVLEHSGIKVYPERHMTTHHQELQQLFGLCWALDDGGCNVL